MLLVLIDKVSPRLGSLLHSISCIPVSQCREDKMCLIRNPPKKLAYVSWIHESVNVTDGKLIVRNERGTSTANVWLAVSDSSCTLQLILPSAFNAIHLLSVAASKSVLLLLHNTAPCEGWKVSSTIQIYSATPTVHLHPHTWIPFLDPGPFMHFVLLMTVDVRHCSWASEDHVDNCVKFGLFLSVTVSPL